MTLDADLIVDRRRTRRRLTAWRLATFLLLAVLAAGAALWATAGEGFGAKSAPHIARISIEGVILEDTALIEMLDKVADADAVKGVILAVDSPGGSATGGEALYESLRKLAAEKPMVTEVHTLAASAGYMVAIASDHIVARRTSITGSIGVYFQYGNVERLLDTLGVEVKTVRSAALKAEPSPFEPANPDAVRAMADLVDDSYQWFVDIVVERRGLDREEALRLSDGRVYSGERARSLALVDALGGEEEAIAWLEEEGGVDTGLPVVDWKPRRPDEGFGLLGWAAGQLARATGFDALTLRDKLALDGLVALWHPQIAD